MASLASLLEDFRNYRGVQDWNLGRQEDQMLGHSEQARGLWQLLQGLGVGDVAGIGAIKRYESLASGDARKQSGFADVFKNNHPQQLVDEPYIGAGGGLDDTYRGFIAEPSALAKGRRTIEYSPSGDVMIEKIRLGSIFPSHPGDKFPAAGYSVTRQEADEWKRQGKDVFRFPTRGPDTTGEQGWFVVNPDGDTVWKRDLVRPSGKGTHFRHYVSEGAMQPDGLYSILGALGLGSLLYNDYGE